MTTLDIVISATDYLELHNIMINYSISHFWLTKVKLVV